ncbi:GNAT family N-acetyltransferase [bacterium]|nr:GNAT family N-acetyltransferase [bacterium]
MIMRKLNRELNKEMKAIYRIWKECGWISDDANEKKSLDAFLEGSNNQIIELNGDPECLICTSPGKMYYGDTTLNITAVTAVTVSHILRKQGAASTLLVSMLGEEAQHGADVAGLGMFEQGYYNRLGFTTMGYEHWFTFDPGKLSIYKKGGIPERLTKKNWKAVHKNLSERIKGHGTVTLDPPELIKAEMLFGKNAFGLGYKQNGKLTHHVWFSTDDAETGPYYVRWMAYSNWDQFLECMGIIKSLEEQVRSISMREPTHIQLQDFIEKPFQLQTITRKSKFESRMRAIAYQQLRILNLENSIAAVCYEGTPFSFNLTLSDPLKAQLPANSTYKGCSGEYTVNIGKESSISQGVTKGLSAVSGSISGFTRLWIGTVPASTIGLSEDLKIDPQLYDQLQKAFFKPYAGSDWDY